MYKKSIVSDTGPLISLEKMEGGYELIQRLYSTIVVPPAVIQELTEYFSSPEEYLEFFNIDHFIQIIPVPINNRLVGINMHKGEAQAISLALKLNKPLLIEESYGRKVAQNLGLNISGIAKQIIIAHKRHIIDTFEVKKKIK